MAFPAATGVRTLLLYSGMRAGSCRAFEPHVGTPNIVLTAVAYDPACASTEIDVFARARSAVAMAVDKTKPGSELWLTDAITSGTLSVALGPPTALPLKLWLVAEPSDVATARAMRDRLVDKAFPVLEELGTGITLDTASRVLATAGLVPDCASASDIAALTEGYDKASLNVYLVGKYGSSYSTPAMNCVAVGHREIIFVAWGNPWVVDPTLAHEIGHALGLIRPKTKWGHTYGVAGFANGNFMWDGPEITDASIGQLYAMNFSGDSWLNASGSPFVRPVVRACQDTWSAGVCPALDHFAAGWP